MYQAPKYILPIIVLAQFCGTSLWFAGNAVASDLIVEFALSDSALSYLTSSVQLGFIVGTLVFAVLMISDRFSPSRVFFVSAFAGAIFNGLIIFPSNTYWSLVFFRFLVGLTLAGIYPVGMKVASDYYEKGLGKSLGYLVGALVLGTAAPHLLSGQWPWKQVILLTSTFAGLGGVLMLVFVPDGPFRVKSTRFNVGIVPELFKIKPFRKAAFGYFGHMWELYAFWAFVPTILIKFTVLHGYYLGNASTLAFVIIAGGSLSCVFGGLLSSKLGAKPVAFLAVLLSGCCCLAFPVLFGQSNSAVFLIYLVIWGIFVIPDSPLFSSLVASSVPAAFRGTALTIVNCFGFAITIGSIQLLAYLFDSIGPIFSMTFLALGPIVSVITLLKGQTKKV